MGKEKKEEEKVVGALPRPHNTQSHRPFGLTQLPRGDTPRLHAVNLNLVIGQW